jgi:hypothetical protein
MAAPNIADMLAVANCFQCLPDQLRELVKLSLLTQLLKVVNPMAAIDVQSLLASASCLQCLSPGERSLIELVLLSEILSAGSIGTGACLMCGAGPPVDPPASTCCIFEDNVSTSPLFGSVWLWDIDNGKWFAVIGGP